MLTTLAYPGTLATTLALAPLLLAEEVVEAEGEVGEKVEGTGEVEGAGAGAGAGEVEVAVAVQDQISQSPSSPV